MSDSGEDPIGSPRPAPPLGPPAGWYLDPSNPADGQRWWNGYQWTEHQLPLQLPPEKSPPPYAGLSTRLYSGDADRAAGTNTAAIWSLVSGICGIVLVIFWWWLGAAGGVAALVWGLVGMRRAQRYGVGYGMSIAGLILGALTVLLVIFRIGTFGL